MAQCVEIAVSGERCKSSAMVDSTDNKCQWHTADIAEEERQRWRALGGRTTAKPIQIWQIPNVEDFSKALREAKTPADILALRRKVAELIATSLIEPAQAEALRRAISDIRESVIDVELLQEQELLSEGEGELISLGGSEADLLVEPESLGVRYINDWRGDQNE